MEKNQCAHDRERLWAGWMRSAKAGDGTAYRRLLAALVPFVRGLVRRGFARLEIGSAEVEDVVQETLLAIHLKRHTWDDGEAITPWVMAIVRHKLIDGLRRRGRHREIPIDDLVDVLPADEPTDRLSGRDAERLLTILRGRQREVVRAVSIEGMTTREAAARFHISEGAVRVALHRGLSALAASFRGSDQ